MIGWLLDTNVITELINPRGAWAVEAWAAAQPEQRLFLSLLTIGEYDKGLHNVAEDDPARPRYIASRVGLIERFAGRLLSVEDAVVRRWGEISGRVKRLNGRAPTVIDSLIAATEIEHDLYLTTRNLRGVRDSGASVFNPWTDEPAAYPLSPRRPRQRGSPRPGAEPGGSPPR